MLVFENRGEEVGATIAHPHGQIYAYDHVPDAPLTELRRADGGALPAVRPGRRRAHRDRGQRLAGLGAPGQRLPVRPAARARRAPARPARRSTARSATASPPLLVDVLARLDRLFDAPLPYMLWIHQRPTDGGAWPEAHVHAHLVSPMRSPGVQRYVAAAELGSGVFVNPVVPEDAAAALRGA